jgi:hypothetical protein
MVIPTPDIQYALISFVYLPPTDNCSPVRELYFINASEVREDFPGFLALWSKETGTFIHFKPRTNHFEYVYSNCHRC